MLFVDNQGDTRPHINLAIEEHLLRSVLPDEDLLFLYINQPSIIVGRFQNTLEEVNQPYVEARGIQVVRRLSGGGAVYHDLNNLNFSFITPKDPESISNFKKFTAPVIRTLNEMGVPADLGVRNDIIVGGRKISGNAQYITGSRMVSHGTLLFASDLSRLGDALHVVPGQITSKGIKSVRSVVTNIADHLPHPMTMDEFRRRIIQGIFAGMDPLPQYHLTRTDWQAIEQLAQQRYLRWEWNYGASPDFSVRKSRPTPDGEIQVVLDVHQGAIRSIDIQAAAVSPSESDTLRQRLTGVLYRRADLLEALEQVVPLLDTPLSMDDWLDLIY